MDSKHLHRHTTQQPRTDNSRQQSSTADVHSQPSKYESSREAVFYLEVDDNPSRDDHTAAESEIATDRFGNSNSNCSNTESDNKREKKTVIWDTRLPHQDRDKDAVSPVQSRQNEDVGGLIAGAQTSSRSPPRPIPSVQRPTSSPVRTVCWTSHSHLVIRCQVNSHDVPHLSSSFPAAFSPVWTKLVQPVLSSSRSKAGSQASSERRRRHTVAGPTTPAQRSQLQELQDHLHALHPHLHHINFDGPASLHDPSEPTLPGLGRSLSDSDLQHLVMREVGLKLRKMSDEFNFFKTGKKLTTVRESVSSDEDSDDEM